MSVDLKDKMRILVMKIIRKTMVRVNKDMDIVKLRKEYNKKQLKLFAINVTDLDYSAVIDTTGSKLELVGEGKVQEYTDIPEINLVVYIESSTLFDIVEGITEPLKAYLLGRIRISKADENTFAADMKILNDVFKYMYINNTGLQHR